MAKVYKVSLYITDYNDEYQDAKHLTGGLNEHIENLWIGVNHLEVKESDEFEWEDDLIINKRNAEKEDFEMYFNKNN